MRDQLRIWYAIFFLPVAFFTCKLIISYMIYSAVSIWNYMVYFDCIKIPCLISSRIIYTLTYSAGVFMFYPHKHAYYRIICGMSILPTAEKQHAYIYLHRLYLSGFTGATESHENKSTHISLYLDSQNGSYRVDYVNMCIAMRSLTLHNLSLFSH